MYTKAAHIYIVVLNYAGVWGENYESKHAEMFEYVSH